MACTRLVGCDLSPFRFAPKSMQRHSESVTGSVGGQRSIARWGGTSDQRVIPRTGVLRGRITHLEAPDDKVDFSVTSRLAVNLTRRVDMSSLCDIDVSVFCL